MAPHQNKPQVAASMGIELPRGDGIANKSQSKQGPGTEIVRRAGYGKVNVESLTKFLEAYMDCGHKAKAALVANLSYSAILKAEKADPDFADEVTQAHELFTAKLEKAAYNAAVKGWKVPKYDAKGNLCGHEWKFSERIMELMLKRHNPAFRDKADIDVKHSGGVVVVQAPALDVGDWKRQVENQSRIVENTLPTSDRRDIVDQP